jgi:hypothetical protein
LEKRLDGRVEVQNEIDESRINSIEQRLIRLENMMKYGLWTLEKGFDVRTMIA